MIRALSGVYGGALMGQAEAGGGGSTDPSLASVTLLAGFEGADNATSYTADIGGAATFTGTSKLSTTQKKFGASSLLLDGSLDYIAFPAAAGLANASGNYTGAFTVEAFVRLTATDTNWCIASQWHGSSGASWALWSNAGVIGLRTTSGGVNYDTQVTQSLTAGVWYHVAVDVTGAGVRRLYIDGVMVATTTVASANGPGESTRSVRVGTIEGFEGSFDLNGNVDELRITRGVARYGSDAGFTVPVEAYPRT